MGRLFLFSLGNPNKERNDSNEFHEKETHLRPDSEKQTEYSNNADTAIATLNEGLKTSLQAVEENIEKIDEISELSDKLKENMKQ